MSDIKITKELNGSNGGRYLARIDGREGEGEITFTIRDGQVISADHTGVPKSMSGEGVAKSLLNFMLEDAKKKTLRSFQYVLLLKRSMSATPSGVIFLQQSPVKRQSYKEE